MLADLSEDKEAARRIAFVLARMSSNLGLPPSATDVLIQAAMERPEAVTPGEFKVAYAMRSKENGALMP